MDMARKTSSGHMYIGLYGRSESFWDGPKLHAGDAHNSISADQEVLSIPRIVNITTIGLIKRMSLSNRTEVENKQCTLCYYFGGTLQVFVLIRPDIRSKLFPSG